MARRLKVISDGSPDGTQLIDVESGETIEGVQSISFDISVDSMATMTIEIMGRTGEMFSAMGTLYPDAISGDIEEGGVFFKEKL